MKRLIVPLIVGLALLIGLTVFVCAKFIGTSVRGSFVLVIVPAATAPEVRMTSAETVSDADEWHGDFVMTDFFAVDATSRLDLVGRDVLTIALHQDGRHLGSFDFTAVGAASDEMSRVSSLVGFLVDTRPAVGSGSMDHLRRALAGNGRASVWQKSGTSSRKGEFLIVATDRGETGGWQVAYLSFKN